MSLIYVENTGAAFSILSDQRWLLVGVAFVASLFLVAILLRYNEGFWGTLGLSAVLGGAVGNLVDRVFNGYVIDMFRPLLFPNFAIFNIADIFITLGGITFCIFFIISSVRSEKKTPESAEPEPDAFDEELYDPYEYAQTQPEDGFDYSSDTKVLPSRRTAAEQAPVYFEPDSDTQVFRTQESEPAESFATGGESREYFEAAQDDAEYYDPAQITREYYAPAQEAQEYHDPAQVTQEYYDPAQDTTEYYAPVPEASVIYIEPPDPQNDFESALTALDALESELGSVEDYDVDALLREYGFEE